MTDELAGLDATAQAQLVRRNPLGPAAGDIISARSAVNSDRAAGIDRAHRSLGLSRSDASFDGVAAVG
ncbi:MAG TPA: hypothetical protein VLF19_09180 [Methylomirabilota bacterium]|nr:hypothetical protein [Methylomirabilota bacterium]